MQFDHVFLFVQTLIIGVGWVKLREGEISAVGLRYAYRQLSFKGFESFILYPVQMNFSSSLCCSYFLLTLKPFPNFHEYFKIKISQND